MDNGEDEDDEERNETPLDLVTRHSNGIEKRDISRSSSVHSTTSPSLVVDSSASDASPLAGLPLMVKPKKYLCSKCPAKFTDR